MTDDEKTASPERARTDESLQTERANADEVLREVQAKAKVEADRVVDHAREVADAVLSSARALADAYLATPVPSAVLDDRVLEDVMVRDARAAADEHLEAERRASASALARLLPMERETTDRYLLTERRRADADVSHRDDFLGIVSHDLRNLLGGIVLTAELHAGDAAVRILRYAARMNRLIGDLVDVASIDAGKLSVARTIGDPAALVEEVIDMFKSLANTKHLTLESDLPARPPTASFDHDRMVQVLANLITNAIKFTAHGTIVVRVVPDATGLRFSVTDTGCGIATAQLDTVFERFWQVGKSDRKGVGLGLYISRCIVEAHGGRIWAESTLGTGTTFSFTLA